MTWRARPRTMRAVDPAPLDQAERLDPLDRLDPLERALVTERPQLVGVAYRITGSRV